MATESVASATLTVDISATCITTQEDLMVELDDDLNGGVTCFTPGQQIYLRIFPQPETMYFTVTNTNGTIAPNATADGLLNITDEYVTISNGEGTAQYPIHGISSMVWHGTEPCPISSVKHDRGRKNLYCVADTCSGGPLSETSCELTAGVLKVSYSSFYYSYVATGASVGKILLLAYETETPSTGEEE